MAKDVNLIVCRFFININYNHFVFSKSSALVPLAGAYLAKDLAVLSHSIELVVCKVKQGRKLGNIHLSLVALLMAGIGVWRLYKESKEKELF
ncbi:hypothetical protein [Allobacillus sp. GCM10007490]|uniref:hypothetical protein n=1 Tax=Allobacillus sp. GCM10007490 TaxID=3317324 RepID=UPI003671FF0B